MELTKYSVSELSKMLSGKEVSSEELTRAYLKNIETREPEIGAYITVTGEEAIAKAKEVDALRANGAELPVLAGIPAGIKDNISTKGVRTTCASKMLENYVPPFDATVMEKLNAQHVVMLGKTNMDEFAMGSTTENSYYKKTKNPANTAHVPGGSSGGSAACVAADLAPYSLGSDTGGSIRQPASFCGVVGLKPTYGSVSRYGLVAFASSLDQIGPITKTVEDAAIVFDGIRGYDPHDATSVKTDMTSSLTDLEKGVKGMTIALPKEFISAEGGISKEVREATLQAAIRYEQLGAKVKEVSMPTLKDALPAYYVISSAEASSNLARFDGVRYGFRAPGSENCEDMESFYRKNRSEGFGAEVKRRIMLGTFALSAGYYDAYYKKALQVRTLVVRDFNKIFEDCDCIMAPVSPTTAYKSGMKVTDPLEMYLGDIYTVTVNIAGLPAISIPCGMGAENLPIGIQLIGKAFDEKTILRVANSFEKGI